MPTVARLALALLLIAVGSPCVACSTSTELRRAHVPREGLALRYGLTVGQGFEGVLRVGNTRAVEGLDQPLSQTATADVTMAVIGERGQGMAVRATFSNVELDWDLPPAATYSSDELVELAAKRLRGMQVELVVRHDGRVQALPRLPDDIPLELAEVIESLVLGLDAFFVPLPPEPLRRGRTWSQTLEHVDDDERRHTLSQALKLEGVFEHRTDDLRLARLSIEQDRMDQRIGSDESGSPRVSVEREVRSRLLFAIGQEAGGYPVELDREIREFDPVEGMVFRKVRAQWQRARGLVPELVGPRGGDVQEIHDPCNPDYVGPKVCDQEVAPPEDAGDETDAGDEADADTAETDAGDDDDDDAADADAPDDDAPDDDNDATDATRTVDATAP